MHKFLRFPSLVWLAALMLAACSQTPAPQVAHDPADLQTQAVSGGQVVAWGDNGFGQTNVPALPEGMTYTAVAAGSLHSLALRNDGQVVAWGDNWYGSTNVPSLPTGMTYTAVAGGYGYSLALRSDGQVVAWGDNSDGQLNVPTPPAGVTYTAVAAGSHHSLALRSDGQVVARGWLASGAPDLLEGMTYTAVAGSNHILALADALPKQNQTLSFTSATPTDARVGGNATITATASSGLTVTLGSATPNETAKLCWGRVEDASLPVLLNH